MAEISPGTLALMALQTLAAMGPLHGYGLARRIEQIASHAGGGPLRVNYGTIYPALIRLEQEGDIAAEWAASENNRRAKLYRITPAGRRRLAREVREWKVTTAVLGRFLALGGER
ncbi:MAG: PadR family transcriptional regulator [Terriglobales bacterium]